ncbi:hypothetical protein MSAN_01676900 [Mycena sanguinolenta]|uniref:Chromo domain-containing protein n=1 Tax=Mycena sanguinolenta TaxID=230812 RepID=A0A8H7CUP8_9AGAR|nr:hypothetical protein MSAN_01676900 [Mycena sanguinolenta]
MPARKRKREPMWFVETILKAQRTKLPASSTKSFLQSEAWVYYVKWGGFPDSDNSWEPIGSFLASDPSPAIILRFWEHVGPESFLINAPGFEVVPTEEWIRKEKLVFASKVPLEEIEAQNRNPKRRRSASPETPSQSRNRNGKQKRSSPPSTSRRSGSRSPRKVSFATDTEERVILGLDEVENTAQFYSSSHQPTADPSDSEDDLPTPRISTEEATPTLPEDPGPEPVPEAPPKTPLPSFFSPPSSPHQGIKFYEQTADAAPTDNINADLTPTLVPDQHTTLEAAGEEGPMLTSMLIDEDTASAGVNTSFYEPDEDHYAGLRNEHVSLQNYDEKSDWFDVEGANAASSDETLDFLNTIELPTSVERGPDYRPSRPICGPAPMTKWAWNGQLSVTVNGQSEAICSKCVITDSTECAPPRISAFVSSQKPLEIPASYNTEDILRYVDGCKCPHQFAQLLADGPDGERLEIFSQYLTRKSQACMMPALWDGDVRGVLLFVPQESKRLLDHLRTPPEVRNTGLVVILLFVDDSPPIEHKYKREILQLNRKVERALMTPEQWRKSLRDERDYHISLRIIQLSKAIRHYAYTHTSTVWSSNDGGRLDQDTVHLLRVLKKSRVGVVSLADTSADIVFIHVGALKNVHELPHLVQRRLRPEVRFCLYGTHKTVPPSLWGFHEIYLLGGAVTFTPEALVNDAWGVLKTIRLIHAHPLWTCFLTPEVVGMAVKLIQLREDEMPEYTDTLPFAFNNILNAIRKDEVLLMMTTPLDNLGDEDDRNWALTNRVFKPRTAPAILEHCMKAFDAAYGSSPQDRWAALARSDLTADMYRMQTQPGARTDYRRFVVLDSSLDSRCNSSGIEWATVGSFDFKDDFTTALEKLSLVI